jgi:hypothetical protein
VEDSETGFENGTLGHLDLTATGINLLVDGLSVRRLAEAAYDSIAPA